MPLAQSYEQARIQVEQLVDRFHRNLTSHKRTEYRGEQARVQFINPVFKARGWDVRNTKGYAEPYKDVKTALLFCERAGPTDEIWYYELPLPEGLKKFSKGRPIQDERFDGARALWAAWDAYRRGEGPRPGPTANSWIVPVDAVKERDYDLAARNPNRDEAETCRHPAEITTSLLEVERQILSIIEELHEMVGDGNGEAV